MDQLIKEMENMRIQFQDMKKEMEYVKGQLKDTKTELNETKIQLEESKIQIEETKIQLQNTKTELFNETKNPPKESKIQLDESKIQLDEAKIQLHESKIQLDESKILREDVMVQLEESKTKISELGETLKNIEELGKTNTKDILANSKMMKPVLEWVEYVNNPCWNCNGAVHCLDGKVVGITRPRNGTKIRTKDWIKYCGKDKDGQAVYVIGAQGVVNENRIDWDFVMYKPAYSKWSTYDDKDFRKFVYSCPKWA